MSLRVKNEEGSALVLVLILITTLSLLLISVAFLTQTTTQSISQSAELSKTRNSYFSSAYALATDCIISGNANPAFKTGSPTCKKGLGAGSASDYSVFQPCSNSTIWGLDITQISPVPTVDPDLTIGCSQPDDSGTTNPMAEFMLVGADCISSCQPGIDGGLALTNAQACNKLNLKGAILNTSGVWSGISDPYCNFNFSSSDSTIITPTSSMASAIPCTANNFTPSQSCGCPTGFTVDDSRCPRNLSYDSLNPLSLNTDPDIQKSYIAAYIKKVKEKILAAPASLATVNECTLSEGIIDEAVLDTLNTKTSDAGVCPTFNLDGSRFYFNATDTITKEANWLIASGVQLLSTNASGTQLIFAGNTTIEIDGSLNINSAGTNSTPVIATSNTWSQSIISPRAFLRVGSGGEIFTKALVFSPKGYAVIQNQAGMNFGSGLLVSALTLNQNSNSSTSLFSPPPFYNGNRLVQLYFRKGGQYFGAVQVQVSDYFGTDMNSAIDVALWDAP